MVNFFKDRCEVLDCEKRTMVTETKLSNNCYQWDKNIQDFKCNLFRLVETMLWHKWLGHMSLPKICKTLKAEAVHGLPLLKQTTDMFCSECSTGKQKKRLTRRMIVVVPLRS